MLCFRYDLLKLCLEGPEDKLNQTKYCQPAIMVTSLAALEQLKDERPNAIESCMATAGFSLGEITSLVFAGAISFDKGKYNRNSNSPPIVEMTIKLNFIHSIQPFVSFKFVPKQCRWRAMSSTVAWQRFSYIRTLSLATH